MTAKRQSYMQPIKRWFDLGVKYNKYTILTLENIDESIENLHKQFSERKDAYKKELHRQKKMEEKRIEFAEAAQGFADYVAQLKKKVAGCTGEPEDKIAEVKAIYNNGEEGNEKLHHVAKIDKECHEMGISYNKHTELNLSILQTRWSQFQSFVENFLVSLSEDADVKAKLAAHAAEWEKKDAIENLKIAFAKKAGEINQWMQNAHGVLTIPLFAKSVADVQQAIAAVSQIEADLPSQDAAREEAAGIAHQLEESGFTGENPLSDLQLPQIDEKIAKTKSLTTERSGVLAEELQKQESHETLRVDFAKKATALNSWLDEQLAAVGQPSDQDESAQLAALGKMSGAQFEMEGSLAAVRAADQQLMDNSITENNHTALTIQDLEAKWKLLQKSIEDKRTVLNSTLEAKKGSQVSAEQLKELKEVFDHFDKDKNGVFDPLEFKACLSSLGEDVSDEDIKAISPDGQLTFEQYVAFMTKRMSDTTTQDEIQASFKLIAGDKPYVSEAEIRNNFQADTAEYLIANMPRSQVEPTAFDYTVFTSAVFSR